MSNKANIVPIVGVILLVMIAPSTSGDMIQLSPSKDNTLYEDSSRNLSNGEGANFYIGETARERIMR